ncbi:MAG: ABC transporter substrate-binding protein [Bacteroidetes bacterium]|nr:MAG: ABC transporter substrate-binding protein [Bacteroidota bacterium]
MKKIIVGGVPEHFNYPWHYGIQYGIFAKHGIDIQWVDVKGGSGAMCKMLDSGELDIALVLTEGIVKHIHTGSDARIIQQFVKSPLIWGVHSNTAKELDSNDLSKARFARSRKGSGSHIMSFVHAEQKGYDISEDNFLTVGNMEGALEAFEQDTADILLWEKFMTQPYVTKGTVNRIGLCVSPWPCFMTAASGGFLKGNHEDITALCNAIVESCVTVTESPDTIEKIAKLHNLKTSQVAEWYSSVEWQTSGWVSKKMLQNVTSTLKRVNILEEQLLSPIDLCYSEAKLY